MSRRRSHTEDEAFELPLIPMIDCMLVIIIYFLVSTTMKHTEPELPIDLPPSGASVEAPVEEDLLVIGVDAQGQRYLNGEVVTTALLHETLKARAQATPGEKKVRIDADQSLPYRDLVEVIELCQFWGFRSIGLHTRDAGKPAKRASIP
jgi:biopolymer transport protein ExbD